MENIIDCRSEEGVTIGLIDSLIFISRIPAKRDLSTENIREALKDLRVDEDLHSILYDKDSEKKILEELARRLGKPSILNV